MTSLITLVERFRCYIYIYIYIYILIFYWKFNKIYYLQLSGDCNEK